MGKKGRRDAKPRKANWFVCCTNGRVKELRKMLDDGSFDVNDVEKGLTPLLLACDTGLPADTVRLLVERGAGVNAETLDGASPLFLVSQDGLLDCARILPGHRADGNKPRRDGARPLSVAAEFGHLEVVRLLLERGAGINNTSANGATALLLASENGHAAVARLLLEHNADKELAAADGATPLVMACSRHHEDVVRVLLERNANTEHAANYLHQCSEPIKELVRESLLKDDVMNAAAEAKASALMR